MRNNGSTKTASFARGKAMFMVKGNCLRLTALIAVGLLVMMSGTVSAVAQTYNYADPIFALLAPDQQVIAIQAKLQQVGCYNGPLTGVFDTLTARAVGRFQAKHDLLSTGVIDQPTAEALGVKLPSDEMGPPIP
jgi:peptidoglycan hydrolase-like protein with peptidoglycan-binding domain